MLWANEFPFGLVEFSFKLVMFKYQFIKANYWCQSGHCSRNFFVPTVNINLFLKISDRSHCFTTDYISPLPPQAALSGRPSAVINPDYSMTKQRYITCIYDKIRSKSPLNRATSPTCLHCDVTHHSLTTGVVTLHIPSRRVGVHEENRGHIKLCGQLMQVEWFVALKMIYVESSITVNISECFCDV